MKKTLYRSVHADKLNVTDTNRNCGAAIGWSNRRAEIAQLESVFCAMEDLSHTLGERVNVLFNALLAIREEADRYVERHLKKRA